LALIVLGYGFSGRCGDKIILIRIPSKPIFPSFCALELREVKI
jgi:hypothetical protein